MSPEELKDFLDLKALEYNRASFIPSDPIQVPHEFDKKEDIEIIAFLTAIIAWGQRKTIIQNAFRLCEMLSYQPHEFILNASDSEIKSLPSFVHRTFQQDDLIYFLRALKHIYRNEGGLETAFDHGSSQLERIVNFRNIFLSLSPLSRTTKHISNPRKASSAKRINMFLRWMVRKSNVDFGIWTKMKSSDLMIPLDIHTGNVGRELGLLKRKQNDWKAVVELSDELRKFDPVDPIKYDLALFGLGAFESFGKEKK